MRPVRLPSLVFIPLLILGVFPAQGEQVIVNGDFELPFDPEWESSLSGLGAVIERGTSFDPDPDYEAHLAHTGGGYVRLAQRVHVPDTEIEAFLRFRLHATATTEAWAAAGIVLEYLDESLVTLGETRIATWTRHCPWEPGPDLHLIEVPGDTWMDYAFNVTEELGELPAVDPTAVRYIQLQLYIQTYEC